MKIGANHLRAYIVIFCACCIPSQHWSQFHSQDLQLHMLQLNFNCLQEQEKKKSPHHPSLLCFLIHHCVSCVAILLSLLQSTWLGVCE
jgi:hypothetical protein